MLHALAGLIFLAALLILCWRIMIWMPGRAFRNRPAPLDEQEQRMRDRLAADLTTLAERIGERNVSHCYLQLVQSAEFIESSLNEAGFETRRQEFEVAGKTVWNVDAHCTGRVDPDKVIIVGAHYDTVPGSPGANDNGTAVVANLELARMFAERAPDCSVRFVFFVNEEEPYYMTEAMGSLRYASECRAEAVDVVGMISLETIGCYLDAPASQRYPIALLRRLYPTTGDFVAVVGNVRSRRFIHNVVRGFRRIDFPSEGMAAPRWLKDIFRSDHAAFWQCGYPALMITDTANFRYAHYHTSDDTVDKINFEGLARVVTGVREALLEAARQSV